MASDSRERSSRLGNEHSISCLLASVFRCCCQFDWRFLVLGEDAALPIVVDEALGTSDDLRAKDIIEALVELAKAGRQIFYFTAQGDEVDKWKEEVLDRHDGVEFKLISFAGENGIDHLENRESDGGFLARTTVPQPGEMSHLEYGVALGVERLNAWTFDRGRLSLWYLVDDLDVLYQCWRRNIRTIDTCWKVTLEYNVMTTSGTPC